MRFGFGNKSFYRFGMLSSIKVATVFQLTSPVSRQGAFWGFQATVPQVRTGLVSMTNIVIIVHEKMFTIGESRPITGTQEKRRANATMVKPWKQFGLAFSKKSENQDTRAILSACHFADMF